MKALAVRLQTSILLSAALWMTSPTHAQRAGTGAVTGTVRDTYGALIPNAQVRLVGEHTHACWSVHTSTQGSFGASPLPPGSYSVMVEAQGFERRFMTAVPVNAGEFTRLYLKLDGRPASSELPVNVAGAETPGCGARIYDVTTGRLHPADRTYRQNVLFHQNVLLAAAIPGGLGHTAITNMNGGGR